MLYFSMLVLLGLALALTLIPAIILTIYSVIQDRKADGPRSPVVATSAGVRVLRAVLASAVIVAIAFVVLLSMR